MVVDSPLPTVPLRLILPWPHAGRAIVLLHDSRARGSNALVARLKICRYTTFE